MDSEDDDDGEGSVLRAIEEMLDGVVPSLGDLSSAAGISG